MTKISKSFELLALAAGLAVAANAGAQTYPSRPIRMIMAIAGGADVVARLIAQKMSQSLGQPVIVEVQAGAGGAVGAETVARSTPDGHTILLASPSSQVMRPFLARSISYDPVRDFTPITKITDTISVVVVNQSLPVNSFRELLDYAKRNPGKVSYGSSGIGSGSHLSGELLRQLTGVNWVHVPYKSGAQSMQDLIGGQIPLVFGVLATVSPQLKSGKLKVLAVVNSARYEHLPEVPTISEIVPGFVRPPAWMSYFGPAGLPRPVVSRLHDEIIRAADPPEVRAKFAGIGFVVNGSSPEELAEELKRNLQQAAEVVKSAGIQPE